MSNNIYIFAPHLKKDSLAQLVEHIPFKDGVLGSSPKRITKKQGNLKSSLFFFMYERKYVSTRTSKHSYNRKAVSYIL